MKKLYFQKSPGSFAICRCPPETTMLDGYNEDSIVALVKTETETTLIVKEDSLPQHCNAVDTGWVLFKITGEFAFDEAGVVLSAIKPLSENDIGVFVLSTYSSDIVLIKEKNLTKAKNHLQNNGHSVTG